MFLPQKMPKAAEVLKPSEPSLPKDVTVILSASQKKTLQRCRCRCAMSYLYGSQI